MGPVGIAHPAEMVPGGRDGCPPAQGQGATATSLALLASAWRPRCCRRCFPVAQWGHGARWGCGCPEPPVPLRSRLWWSSGPLHAVTWAGGTSPPLSIFRIAGSGEKMYFWSLICFSFRVYIFFFPLLILNGPKPLTS